MAEEERIVVPKPTIKVKGSQQFARDIIWVGIAQLFNSFIVGIVTMPSLTRSYSTEIFGIWAQVNVTVGLLGPLIGLQLTVAVIRFLSSEEDKAKRRQVMGAMLLAITITAGLFFIIANLVVQQLSAILFGNPGYATFTKLTILWIIVSSYYTFFISYLRSRDKIKLLSIRQIVLSLVSLTIIMVLATRGISLEWVILAIIAVWVLFTLAFFIMVVHEIGWPIPNVKDLKSYLAFSVPQMPSGILFWVINSSDRFFITHFLDLSQAGIYATSRTLGTLVSLFYFPIQFVLYPTLSRLWEDNRLDEIKQYLGYSTKLFLTMAIPSAAGIAILSQPLLKLLTTADYLAGYGLVLLVAIGTIFQGLYFNNLNVILLYKKTKLLPLLIGAASLVNVVFNVLLLPYIGLVGSGVSNLLSFLVLALVVGFWAGKQVGYRVDFKYLIKLICATLIMSFSIYFIKVQSIAGLIFTVIIGALVVLISLFMMKAFSRQDKRLIGNFLEGMIPKRKDKSTPGN